MIITVTLNAAIDKSLAVPNFRLGRRHRTVEQRTMAGGKGVNIARTPEVARPAGDRDRLRGRRHRHAHRRAAHGGVDPQRLRAHPRGVAHEHVGARPDDRASRPRSTNAARRCPTREVELFRDKLLYLARGAAIVVFAGSLPRGVEPDMYASLIRDLERLDVITVVDTDGEPLRQAVRAEPDVVSPERARGGGARRPRVRQRGGALAARWRRSPRWGPARRS